MALERFPAVVNFLSSDPRLKLSNMFKSVIVCLCAINSYV